MSNSILSPDMKGVMFISGYRGKGKTFLAAHVDYPENIIFFDFDEGKAEGLHNQLSFGCYEPIEENEPLKRADKFSSVLKDIPQDVFTVAIIDDVLPLEKAMQAIVYRDAKRYSNIYGYPVNHILTDNFGRARGIANDLIGDAIAKPLHAKGIKLIIVTSHVKEKYKVPGKMIIQGKDRWQDLSILTLILVGGDNYPTPSAIVQKEALGKITVANRENHDLIMQGEISSHDMLRRLPPRLPNANWQSIRKYLQIGVDLENLQKGEKLILEESEPFTDRLSKEQIAYQLGVLEKEKEERETQIATELMLKQSQGIAIREYIHNNFNGLPGPIKVSKLKSAIEAGELSYDGKITIGKVNEWSK